MSDELYTQCPKCGCVSGDAWAQCGGVCPMPMSPVYSPAAALQYGPPRQVPASDVYAFQVVCDEREAKEHAGEEDGEEDIPF